jgi:hypothetical protein
MAEIKSYIFDRNYTDFVIEIVLEHCFKFTS